jgi:hypothetical protein
VLQQVLVNVTAATDVMKILIPPHLHRTLILNEHLHQSGYDLHPAYVFICIDPYETISHVSYRPMHLQGVSDLLNVRDPILPPVCTTHLVPSLQEEATRRHAAVRRNTMPSFVASRLLRPSPTMHPLQPTFLHHLRKFLHSLSGRTRLLLFGILNFVIH